LRPFDRRRPGYCSTVALRKPAPKGVAATVGPTDQKRLGHVSQFADEVLSNPAAALNVTVGM